VAEESEARRPNVPAVTGRYDVVRISSSAPRSTRSRFVR
jgi:hypothetical protein